MKDIAVLFQQIDTIMGLAVEVSGQIDAHDGLYTNDFTEKVVTVDMLHKYQRELLPIPLQPFHYPKAGKVVSVFQNEYHTTFRLHVLIKDIDHQFGLNIDINPGTSEQDASFIAEREVKIFRAFMDKELREKFPSYNKRF